MKEWSHDAQWSFWFSDRCLYNQDHHEAQQWRERETGSPTAWCRISRSWAVVFLRHHLLRRSMYTWVISKELSNFANSFAEPWPIWIEQWNNFEDQLRFGKVMRKTKELPFWLTPKNWYTNLRNIWRLSNFKLAKIIIQGTEAGRRRGKLRKSSRDIKEWTGHSRSTLLYNADDINQWAAITAEASVGVCQRRLGVTGVRKFGILIHP